MDSTLSLRLAQSPDSKEIARLAALDSARQPRGDVILAEVDGDAVAAISVSDGAVVANPFVHTAAVVQALRLRRSQLTAPALALPARLRRRSGTRAARAGA